MGNCIRPSTNIRQHHEVDNMGNRQQQQQQKRELETDPHHDQSVNGNVDGIKRGDEGDGGGGVKVKIVLTKEELQWLMFELKVDNGQKKLEALLGEIERGRGKSKAWKPSLESILEIPEVLEKRSMSS